MDSFSPLVTPLGHGQSQRYLSSNATTVNDFSSTLLDTIFPGFSLIQSFLLSTVSIDIGVVVTLSALILGAIKFVGIAGTWLSDNVVVYFTTSVHINDTDELYDAFTRWAAKSKLSRVARETQVVTPQKNLLDLQEAIPASARVKGNGLFNFKQARAEAQLKTELHFGYHLLWHHHVPILVCRYYRSQSQSISLSYLEDKEAWYLACLGRSRKPLMSLLEHVRKTDAAEYDHLTQVRRPAMAWGDMRWRRATTRGIRPMQSVIMEQEAKQTVVCDLNDFIWPQSALWYANRGIPHRRGYLFSGPPGTGKTSLSFALAGVFGLHLYVLSLTDRGLTDSGLLDLFCALPDRCLVLLEDIDTAGLKRKGMSDTDKETSSSKDNDALAPKSPNDNNSHADTKVTLSGLLNAIDGVATHEGRVIIMTSNCPDELDPALIRPGRIDKHIRFGLASRAQMQELFLSMYTREAGPGPGPGQAASPPHASCPSSSSSSPSPTTSILAATHPIRDSATRVSAIPGYTLAELRRLSDDFAQSIPEHTFSPAEIQGFLLLAGRRDVPNRAVHEVTTWVTEKAAEKAKKDEAATRTHAHGGLTGIWRFMG